MGIGNFGKRELDFVKKFVLKKTPFQDITTAITINAQPVTERKDRPHGRPRPGMGLRHCGSVAQHSRE